MTTPAVPRRVELTVELPGATPERVWDAIATGWGLSSWMGPTDLDEHVGGTVVFRMGPGSESKGRITGWDPPHRIEYEEPDWPELYGQDKEGRTPLVSEFVVEADSGGSCVLRVVTSAFGTGADWEAEFFEEMAHGWFPMFDLLRLYLRDFAGRAATAMDASALVPHEPAVVRAAMAQALGVGAVGGAVDARGVTGTVEVDDESHLLVRLDPPVPGILRFAAWPDHAGSGTRALVGGYLFSEQAPAYVEREEPGWVDWLRALEPPAG
ncbi:MAG: SRPBCC domain-containing protein [Acidimicrobiia bacterium]